MSRIKKIIAFEIINSRGYPTIYAKLILDNGREVSVSVPSFERLYDCQKVELKDGDPERFDGNGVKKAVSYINDLISPKLSGVFLEKQLEIDNWLIKADATPKKNILGINTISTISYLIAKAAAADQGIALFKYINLLFNKITGQNLQIEKLPSPIFPILIGGKHGQIDLDFKEFQIIPSSSFTYSKAYQIGVDIYHLLRHFYKFNFNFNLDVIAAIKEAVEKKSFFLGRDLFLGLNFSASAYYSSNRYRFRDKQQPISGEEYFKFLEDNILKKYFPLIVSDCFANEDWSNWIKLNKIISKETYLVADELICSNREKLEKAVKEKACSLVVIRPNQIGTVSETIAFIDFAKKNNFGYQIASDLGETNDNFIADFSVGVGAEFINFGPPVHGENVSKYNRLLEIEKELKLT